MKLFLKLIFILLFSIFYFLFSDIIIAQMPPGGGGGSGSAFTLTVNKSGTGGGTVNSFPSGINCGAVCSANFNQGTSVLLSATADNGSVFSGWQSAFCSGTGSCTVNIFSDITVMAVFDLSGGGGGGTPPPPPPTNAPSIFSIEPGKADNDKTVDITIKGSNFSPDMISKLTKSGETDIVGVNGYFINSGSIIWTFDIRNKATGNWTVSVANSSGAAVYNSLIVNKSLTGGDKEEEPLGPAPVIISISPTAAYNNPDFNKEEIEKINISGFNFDKESIPYLIRSDGDYVEPADFEFIYPRLLFGYFNLMGVPSGYWDLVVFNSDGQWAQLANAFNVVEAPAKGIFNRDRFFPQSGLKYTVDLLNKWLGVGGEEKEVLSEEEFVEEIPTEEEIYAPEENFKDYEEEVRIEEPISPSILEDQFNKWQVILELIKKNIDLFIGKVRRLFSKNA